MDILPRITGQLIDRFREMSLIQRATAFAFVLLAVLGFGLLLISSNHSEFRPISFGKSFGNEELVSAERALVSAGLTGYRKDGQRLLAPAKDLDRYNAALLESDALPADLGSQMLKQYETLGPFSTDRQRQQMKEALLLQELRRMIKAVPEIEEARVAVALSDRRTGWNQRPRTTANVTITPRAGREISMTLVNSLRQVVASMVPELQPADVTIFDVTRGEVFSGETKVESLESRYLSRAREFARQIEQQILKALSHIPHVAVVAQIDLDKLISSITRIESIRARGDVSPVANRPAAIEDRENHRTGFRGPAQGPVEPDREIYEQTMIAAMPKALRVSVSIPRDYLREVVSRPSARVEKSSGRRDLSSVEDEVLTKVERIVARLIPADSTTNSISVIFVDRLDGTSPDHSNLFGRPIDPLTMWSGAIALAFLAFIGLATLRRSPSLVVEDRLVSSEIEGMEQSLATTSHPIATTGVEVSHPDRTFLLRDEIRALVQSDPAASVELLGKWLSEAEPS